MQYVFRWVANMACMVRVKVVPSSGRQAFVMGKGGEVKAYLKSPPERGLANQELCDLLADRLGIPKARVSLVMGAAVRVKRVKIDMDITEAEVLARLNLDVQHALL